MAEFTLKTARAFIVRNKFITAADCALLLCNVNPAEQPDDHMPPDYNHWAGQIKAMIVSGLLQTEHGCMNTTADTRLYLDHFIQCVEDEGWPLPDAFKDAAATQYKIPFSLIGRDKEMATPPELVYLQFIRENAELQILFEGLVHFRDRTASVKKMEYHFAEQGMKQPRPKVFRLIVQEAKKSQ